MGEDRGDGSSAGPPPPPFGSAPTASGGSPRPAGGAGAPGAGNFSATNSNSSAAGFTPPVSNASRLSSSPSDWEWRDRSDDAFSQLAVFHVPDKPLLHQDAKNRAHTSLPLNLVVRPSQNHPSRMGIWSVDTIPCGVRFGPLIGEIRLANAESALLCPMEASGAGGPPPTPPPTEAPQSWKILTPSGGRIVKTIHVDDDARSNWMKFVNVAVSTETQNLVACQVDKEIYFFSIVQIKPNTELTFWFSREYALRMNYPTSCELARTVQVPKSLKQPWIVQEQRERQREEVRSASPVEALDFSIKKDTTSLNSLKEIHLIEGSRSEKAEQADTAECGENSDSETSPLCSDSDNSSEKSSKSNSCSPPVAEVQQAARANVIQNPVVRPVPTRIPIFADAGPIRPRALDPLAIFQDYFRRTTQQMTKELCKFPAGGLWVPPGTAAAAVAASAASAASRLPASGQPSDVQPVLGATAGAPFAQYGIYGNQEIKPIFNSTSFGAGGLSSHFGGGHGGGGGSFPAPPFPAASGTPAPNDGFGPPKYIQHQENGKTRYACKECHKTFGQLSNLKVHVRTHTGERPFKCTVCGKEFTQLAHLQKHNLVHTGERPHRCEICDKRFSSTSNLKTHLRLHNGQKPYTCDVCNAKFTQYVHLRLHKRLHANERPYSCSTCGKKYISPSGLRTHWKTTTCKPDKDMKLDREDEDDISSTTGHMIKEEEDLDMESLQPSYSGMSSSIHMSQPTSSNSLPPMSSNGHVHSSGHSGLGSSLASLGNPNLNGGLSNGLNGGLSNINGGLSNGLNGLNGNMGGLVGGMNGHGANLQNSLGPNGLCQPNGMGNGFGNGLGSDLNCINNNRLMSNGLNGFMPHGMNNNNNNNIVGSHGLIGSTGVINNGHPHHRQLVGHQGLPPQHSGMGLGNSLPALNDPNNPLHQPLKLPELNSLKNSLFQNNFGYQ